MDDNESIMKEN